MLSTKKSKRMPYLLYLKDWSVFATASSLEWLFVENKTISITPTLKWLALISWCTLLLLVSIKHLEIIWSHFKPHLNHSLVGPPKSQGEAFPCICWCSTLTVKYILQELLHWPIPTYTNTCWCRSKGQLFIITFPIQLKLSIINYLMYHIKLLLKYFHVETPNSIIVVFSAANWNSFPPGKWIIVSLSNRVKG